MSRPRITYFDIRGRVEPVRLIFEELAISYEDRRITSMEEWQALKPGGDAPRLRPRRPHSSICNPE